MDFGALKSPHFTPTCKNGFWASANGRINTSSFSCVLPFYYSQRLKLKSNSVIVAAAKKNKKNIKNKEDLHSFVARPDEATGPYPEAVLLKENKVEEDGRLVPEFADANERELFESLNLELESERKERMRHYQVIYLIHEDREEEVEDVNTKIQEFLKEKKGKIWRFNDWGMRRLAYKIKKCTHAHYILMNFELEAKWANDFKTLLDKDERIIRHLVMKKKEAITEDCPPPPEYHTMQFDDIEDDYEEADEYEESDEYEEGDEDDDDDDEGIIYVDDEDDDEDDDVDKDDEGIIYEDEDEDDDDGDNDDARDREKQETLKEMPGGSRKARSAQGDAGWSRKTRSAQRVGR